MQDGLEEVPLSRVLTVKQVQELGAGRRRGGSEAAAGGKAGARWPRSWPGEAQRFSEVKEGAWGQAPGNSDSMLLLSPGHVWVCTLHAPSRGGRGAVNSNSAAFVFSAIMLEASLNTPRVSLQ